MAVKRPSPIDLYRASPEIAPSAQLDARVLAAARTARATSRRHEWLVAGAAAAAVAAMFYIRIATTTSQDFASTGYGRDEGLAGAWLMDLDLQQPTGPGSQEGLR